MKREKDKVGQDECNPAKRLYRKCIGIKLAQGFPQAIEWFGGHIIS